MRAPARSADKKSSHDVRALFQIVTHTRGSVALVRAAAKDNVPLGLLLLGILYRDGETAADGTTLIRKDTRRALKLFRRAADAGEPSAMYEVANMLTEGKFSARALSAAEGWYRKAFRLGESTAAYNLATKYRYLGRHARAVQWYRKALAAGDASALIPLARAELYGLGTRRNIASALERLQRMSRDRTTYAPAHWLPCEAMVILAELHLEGWFVRRDVEKAVRWFRRAAAWDSEPAKQHLARLGRLP